MLHCFGEQQQGVLCSCELVLCMFSPCLHLPSHFFLLLFSVQPMETIGHTLHRYLSEMPWGGHLCFPDILHHTVYKACLAHLFCWSQNSASTNLMFLLFFWFHRMRRSPNRRWASDRLRLVSLVFSQLFNFLRSAVGLVGTWGRFLICIQLHMYLHCDWPCNRLLFRPEHLCTPVGAQLCSVSYHSHIRANLGASLVCCSSSHWMCAYMCSAESINAFVLVVSDVVLSYISQIRKLRRELDASQEKVSALTTQMSANVREQAHTQTHTILNTYIRPFVRCLSSVPCPKHLCYKKRAFF